MFLSSGVPAEFTVFTKKAGEGDVDVRVIDNNGEKVPADITDNKDGTYSVVYYPTAVGAYTVNITFNSESIPKSPFRVNVCQTNSAACRAYGPGLEKGFVNQNNEFKIETKGAGEGGLGLTIEGPSEAQIECKDNGDGSCDVTYLPPDPGDYVINILFADEHIPGSPFKARISYPFDASKVKVEGPGIEPGIRAGEPADIDIDTRLAGDAELKVEAVDELNSPVQCDIDEEEYGIYAVTYYPKKKGKILFFRALLRYKTRVGCIFKTHTCFTSLLQRSPSVNSFPALSIAGRWVLDVTLSSSASYCYAQVSLDFSLPRKKK